MKARVLVIGSKRYARGEYRLADYVMDIAEAMGGCVGAKDALREALASVPFNVPEEAQEAARYILACWAGERGNRLIKVAQ